MKQAKSIALIGLAAGLILFAHYAGADDGVTRAGNDGVVAQGQGTAAADVRIGNPVRGRAAPGQIPRVEPHLNADRANTPQTGEGTDDCRTQGSNVVIRFLIDQLPRRICN